MRLTTEQFNDFCILSGCDYCPYIYNIGSITAYSLIKKYSSIENIISEKKINLPDNYDYETARHIFTNFDDYDISSEINRTQMDLDGLKEFLINKNFKEIQIAKYIKKFNSF